MSFSATSPTHASHPDRRGFTLIELLVTISIIAVLVGILLPVLGTARTTAKHVKASSDIRQLMLGHTYYQGDYKGHVPWGYTPTAIGGQPVMVNSSSGHSFGVPVAERYPWRVEQYVDGVWEMLHSHHPVPDQPQPGDSTADAFLKAYLLSLYPSFGMNGIFVGGYDGLFEGFKINPGTGYNVPNTGKHVVFYEQEVKRTSDLIVFAEAQARINNNSAFSDDPQGGFHTVSPPYAKGHRWEAVGGDFNSLLPSQIQGIPDGRYNDLTVTAFFDGHAAGMSATQLDDMRLWANKATTADYDF